MTRNKLNYILAVIAWALTLACVLAYEFVWLPNHHEAPEPEPYPVVEELPVVQVIPTETETREAIAFYPVPLDHDLQAFIIHTCEELHIDPSIVVAMIDRESSYDPENIGDGGASYGLMQVQPRWHQERMDKHGVTDLFNPLQNVTVGIDYLAELHSKYDGNIEMALIAYNAGPTGAYDRYFSKGVYSNNYSDAVLANSESLKEAVDYAYR